MRNIWMSFTLQCHNITVIIVVNLNKANQTEWQYQLELNCEIATFLHCNCFFVPPLQKKAQNGRKKHRWRKCRDIFISHQMYSHGSCTNSSEQMFTWLYPRNLRFTIHWLSVSIHIASSHTLWAISLFYSLQTAPRFNSHSHICEHKHSYSTFDSAIYLMYCFVYAKTQAIAAERDCWAPNPFIHTYFVIEIVHRADCLMEWRCFGLDRYNLA